MAYNKRNLLLRIIEIKAIMSQERKRGVTQRWVYNNLIKDRYFISEATFNNYLARNAKRELKELEASEASQNKQLQLF